MKMIVKTLGVAAILLVVTGILVSQVQAQKGIPGTPEFGFGAILYAGAADSLDVGLALAGDLKPDWVYVPISWAEVFPSPNQPNLGLLDRVMGEAARLQTPVVFSITSAPTWAMTPQGPDPALTAQISLILARQYPGQVKAIELFPCANTSQGWGSAPNPAAYLGLYRAARQLFQSEAVEMTFVAGGLQPLPASPLPGDMSDLTFLQGLYDAGAREWMPVVSLQLTHLTGEPLAAPSSSEHGVLRHYEMVRQVMVNNQHINGLLWITRLSVPSGQINTADAVYADETRQAEWLQRAYVQLRSQLYIGAAFLVSLNPCEADTRVTSMGRLDGSRHSFYATLRDMVNQNRKADLTQKPGRPKDGSLYKLKQDGPGL